MTVGEAVKKVQEGHERVLFLMNTLRNITPILRKEITEGRKENALHALAIIEDELKKTLEVFYPENNELHTESKRVSSTVRASRRKS